MLFGYEKLSFSKSDVSDSAFRWAEFFAGGGMARAGLGTNWSCVFSNDNDIKKIESYRENWSSDHLIHCDIQSVPIDLVPDDLTLAWASSPCQNFSAAGAGDGLLGANSSVFVKWWELIARKAEFNRAPKIIVLENVVGLLKSRGGLDFEEISESFAKAGYSFGVLVVDTIHFLPQSRPRIFIVAVKSEHVLPEELVSDIPLSTWHPSHLVKAVDSLPDSLKKRHIWWKMPEAVMRSSKLGDFINNESLDVKWHSDAQTLKLLSSMTQTNLDKITAAKQSGVVTIGTLYRRMRSYDGVSTSRAEVRFDGVAGCLRASDGGSSRQILLFVEGENVRTRHMTPRESARLMGLPDSYKLPVTKTHAVKLVGDGVAVPVVKYLDEHLLQPLAKFVLAERKLVEPILLAHSNPSLTICIA